MPSLEEVLAGLKPFQRATVDYVSDKFLAGQTRFLVADEVGLGKTKIANGILARLMDARPQGQTADILYVCSNAAIARKNMQELKAVESDQQDATRLALLAHPRSKLVRGEGGVNLISLTPGTSFQAANGTGWALERAFIRNILTSNTRRADRLDGLLRRGVGKEKWKSLVDRYPADLDNPSVVRFLEAVEHGPLHEALESFREGTMDKNEHWRLIGRLRHALALASVETLNPAFIIFDEFQRFSELFGTAQSDEPEVRAMARELMDAFLAHERGPAAAKVLFLSATPYRMLSLHEDDPVAGDHHREFLQVVETLYGAERGPDIKRQLLDDFATMRRALVGYRDGGDVTDLASARDKVQRPLRQVIARTERVDPQRPNAGIERTLLNVEVTAADLLQAKAAHAVARRVGAPRIVEFWKSAPYLFSFMGQYTLNRKVAEHADASLKKLARPALFREPPPGKPLDFGNGRMRALAAKVLDTDKLYQRLWLPPALPYVKSDTPPLTKTLIFSAWQVAPEAIAGLISFEAERRLRTELDGKHATSPGGEDRRQALRLAVDEQHIRVSLQAFALLWPSPYLAHLIDPMALWQQHGPLEPERMLELAREKLRTDWPGAPSVTDPAEAWKLISWLDVRHGQPVDTKALQDRLGTAHKSEAIETLTRLFSAPDMSDLEEDGGQPSEAVIDYLARLALGSPAICARRALGRLGATNLDADAADLADAMVTMFNKPEIAPLRARNGQSGWKNFLDIALHDDLQAVLDEYLFVLDQGRPPEAKKFARATAALRMNNAPINLYNPFRKRTGRKVREGNLTSHLAMRFAANVTRDDNTTRDNDQNFHIDHLLDAFNSPFRPFVLASTSVGQEGLDFHKYCHRLWHWNLPSNPVDLEQREGRIQRFMGHAVRLNMAQAAGETVRHAAGLPWQNVVTAAERKAAQNGTSGPEGLEPFWFVKGDAKVESVIPVPPMSRDAEMAERVQKNIANYRLAFGQARQDDLMRIIGELGTEEANRLRQIGLVSLRPPRSRPAEQAQEQRG